jgi:hypothetical protein
MAGTDMIDGMWNLLFGCRHKRITRPITPVHKPGSAAGQTYVTCLECGQQFCYDIVKMQLGPAMRRDDKPGSGSGAFQNQY